MFEMKFDHLLLRDWTGVLDDLNQCTGDICMLFHQESVQLYRLHSTLLEAGAYIIIPESSKWTLFNPRARAFTTIIDNLRLGANYFLAIFLALASWRV